MGGITSICIKVNVSHMEILVFCLFACMLLKLFFLYPKDMEIGKRSVEKRMERKEKIERRGEEGRRGKERGGEG